jgi:sigma-B regulation protein RsbU (phosphoserine phosphatase)
MNQKALKSDDGSGLSADVVVSAFQAQSALFEQFISMAKSPDGEPEVITTMLRKSIDISLSLTGAELGSLVLLDSDGSVYDSILCRGDISPDASNSLIDSVFKKGLAGWVIGNREIGLVNDTLKDNRWLILPDQPYIARSALAIPIISCEMLLGILTLTHSRVAHFTQKTAELMRVTATQMAMILDNAYLFANLNDSFVSLGKAKKEIEVYSRALDLELENCRQIQKSFLPRKLPNLPGWQFETYFSPARRVAGDFYDAFQMPGGNIGIVIGDVCDKGAGAALYMALYRSLIRIFSGQARLGRTPLDKKARTVGGMPGSASARHYDPAEAMRAVALTNDYIAKNNEMGMFATFFFGVLDHRNGTLVYISGGHEPVFVIDRNGIKDRLTQTGPAVGWIPEAKFEYREYPLAPGDMLFSYTDGVVDACSERGERYTQERLIELLSRPAADVAELVKKVESSLFAYIGNQPLEDDITIMALQRKSD